VQGEWTSSISHLEEISPLDLVFDSVDFFGNRVFRHALGSASILSGSSVRRLRLTRTRKEKGIDLPFKPRKEKVEYICLSPRTLDPFHRLRLPRLVKREMCKNNDLKRLRLNVGLVLAVVLTQGPIAIFISYQISNTFS